MALGFALALDGVILASLVWDEMLGTGLLRLAQLAVAIGWLAGVVMNRRRLARRDKVDAAGDLFPAALAEYLQGNWFVAEQKCRDLIRLRRDDVEARLLLATLLRHVDRKDEARAELDLLAKFDGAAAWSYEIERERVFLEQEEESDETEADEHETEPPAIRRAA